MKKVIQCPPILIDNEIRKKIPMFHSLVQAPVGKSGRYPTSLGDHPKFSILSKRKGYFRKLKPAAETRSDARIWPDTHRHSPSGPGGKGKAKHELPVTTVLAFPHPILLFSLATTEDFAQQCLGVQVADWRSRRLYVCVGGRVGVCACAGGEFTMRFPMPLP